MKTVQVNIFDKNSLAAMSKTFSLPEGLPSEKEYADLRSAVDEFFAEANLVYGRYFYESISLDDLSSEQKSLLNDLNIALD